MPRRPRVHLDWVPVHSEFVICLDNAGNDASLIVGKVYETIANPSASEQRMLRVLVEDTSEPDGYLYQAEMSANVELAESIKRRLQCYGRAEGI
jgi:hypothetical protein